MKQRKPELKYTEFLLYKDTSGYLCCYQFYAKKMFTKVVSNFMIYKMTLGSLKSMDY